jgi:hypothetical protein
MLGDLFLLLNPSNSLIPVNTSYLSAGSKNKNCQKDYYDSLHRGLSIMVEMHQ